MLLGLTRWLVESAHELCIVRCVHGAAGTTASCASSHDSRHTKNTLSLAHPPTRPSPPPRPRRSKPAITDLAIIGFLRWTMTINPENFTPLVSYPVNGWAYYRIDVAFTSGWKETHVCT